MGSTEGGLNCRAQLKVGSTTGLNRCPPFNSILSEIIEDMTDLTEGTRTRMDRQTADVARLGNEKGTCYLWGVVIALFLVIIVLISLP